MGDVITTVWMLLLALSSIFLWRYSYRTKMIALGVAVIFEAKRVSEEYPYEYPAYREHAKESFSTHGIGHLAELLP